MTQYRPTPDDIQRASIKQTIRKEAAKTPYPNVNTRSNGEESGHFPQVPMNFTKGLPHDAFGIVDSTAYGLWVDEISESYQHTVVADFKTVPTGRDQLNGQFDWRGWESPRSGHAYDLMGPDSGEVGMAPAPALGSDRLIAEMAEVYAMALLRDHTFDAIDAPADGDLASTLRAMLEQLPGYAGRIGGNRLFRGNTPDAEKGPYLSQFLVQGPEGTGTVPYGQQSINLDCLSYPANKDYMTTWSAWLDVQRGADVGALQASGTAQAMTTPRVLASYVHRDALYQAYQVATLTLLGGAQKPEFQSGFPSGGRDEPRASFATFGDPDILRLVTEVSSRALKAVRRQKFNHHRRARPERIAAMLTLIENDAGHVLGTAKGGLERMHSELERIGLLQLISDHNDTMGNTLADTVPAWDHQPSWLNKRNLLLPMAFVEGSPMHPAYGAGHATVAGACVTVLKTFFDLFPKGHAVPFSSLGLDVLSPDRTPSGDAPADLTITGELDKLASNISIGRNFAGVHFHSDYFDSARMGERIALGVVGEQLLGFGEPISIEFQSFDGDHVRVETIGQSFPRQLRYVITDKDGRRVDFDSWWVRHLPGAHNA